MPRLSRITVFPIKSLPGVELAEARLTARGALMHDREYALVDGGGAFINGKRDARVHALGAGCAIEQGRVLVTLRGDAAARTFALDEPNQRAALCTHLTQYFGEPVAIVRNTEGGFPDDTDYPGPTLIAEASLVEVASWFPGETAARIRPRFRVNLEVADCPAFWEDSLYGETGVEIPFRVGEAALLGTNPCRRCVVPTRDPSSGVETPRFQRRFVEQRRATLPAWASTSRFDFYYRLSINTRARADQTGKLLRVGDTIALP